MKDNNLIEKEIISYMKSEADEDIKITGKNLNEIFKNLKQDYENYPEVGGFKIATNIDLLLKQVIKKYSPYVKKCVSCNDVFFRIKPIKEKYYMENNCNSCNAKLNKITQQGIKYHEEIRKNKKLFKEEIKSQIKKLKIEDDLVDYLYDVITRLEPLTREIVQNDFDGYTFYSEAIEEAYDVVIDDIAKEGGPGIIDVLLPLLDYFVGNYYVTRSWLI